MFEGDLKGFIEAFLQLLSSPPWFLVHVFSDKKAVLGYLRYLGFYFSLVIIIAFLSYNVPR